MRDVCYIESGCRRRSEANFDADGEEVDVFIPLCYRLNGPATYEFRVSYLVEVTKGEALPFDSNAESILENMPVAEAEEEIRALYAALYGGAIDVLAANVDPIDA